MRNMNMRLIATSVQFTQSCPTLCDPVDCSTPDFPVHHQLPDLLKFMSIDRWMDKEDVVHTNNGILLSHKKEWNNAICSKMNGSRDYYTKSIRERQILYDSHFHVESKMWHKWTFLLGWCKSNFSFALLNFAIWYWNTFLIVVIHHFNVHFLLYVFC